MTKTIAEILPEEKQHPRNQSEYDAGIEEGYNECLRDCLKSLQDAELCPVPSLTKISNIVMEHVILTDRGWLLHDKSADNIAKALRSYLLGKG